MQDHAASPIQAGEFFEMLRARRQPDWINPSAGESGMRIPGEFDSLSKS